MANRSSYDVQVRGVPADIRTRLRKRSAGKGVSMSRYVIDLLRDDLERPTMAEWLDEIKGLPRAARVEVDSVALIRQIRKDAEEGIAD